LETPSHSVRKSPRNQEIPAFQTLVDLTPFQDLLAIDAFVNVNVDSSATHSRVAEESVKSIETVLSLWLVKIISV